MIVSVCMRRKWEYFLIQSVGFVRSVAKCNNIVSGRGETSILILMYIGVILGKTGALTHCDCVAITYKAKVILV